jgi:prefoldin subunit 5
LLFLKNDKTFQFFPDETKTDYWLILRNNKNTLEETIAKQNEQIAELIQEIEKLKKSVADLVKTA